MKCQHRKLFYPGLFAYMMLFTNNPISFGQLPQNASIDLYSIAIISIAGEIMKEDTSNTIDSLYFTLPSNVDCIPPAKINDVDIIYLNIDSLSLANGGYLVFNINPLYEVDEKLKLHYLIEYLILHEMDQSWVCCQGCSAGGDVVFHYNDENKAYEIKEITYYNCFNQ
ncbi:MAG TPA: hypothetical protein PKL06_01740 [Chitinophagales bacterium]|nr:hypothetical protein [Chitinophagales bacterium]